MNSFNSYQVRFIATKQLVPPVVMLMKILGTFSTIRSVAFLWVSVNTFSYRLKNDLCSIGYVYEFKKMLGKVACLFKVKANQYS